MFIKWVYQRNTCTYIYIYRIDKFNFYIYNISTDPLNWTDFWTHGITNSQIFWADYAEKEYTRFLLDLQVFF